MARDDSPAYREGHHWVSPFNFDPVVRDDLAFPDPLTIFDSTLRKIIYTSGVHPSVDDVLHVAEALEEVGVREMIFDVNSWADATPERLEYEACRAILARGFAFRVSVHSDMLTPSPAYYEHRADYPVSGRQVVDMLRDIGMGTMVAMPRDLKDPTARSRQSARLAEVFSYAQSLGVSCVLALPDVGRMAFESVVRLANEGIHLGAVRLDLIDSFSSLSPEGMRLFITRFKAQLAAPVPITMHTHNDFGLASATAVAAATAGAHPDVSVNGLSYRSGFAALEEVAVSLELLYGVHTGIRLDRLTWLAGVVAERSGLPTPPLKPITGSHAFLGDNPGWVLQYLKVGPDGFPPPLSCFVPSIVGGRTQIVWGNRHSSFVIQAKLRQMGLKASEEQELEIRRRIEAGVQALESYPRWLTEEQVEAICRAVVL